MGGIVVFLFDCFEIFFILFFVFAVFKVGYESGFFDDNSVCAFFFDIHVFILC